MLVDGSSTEAWDGLSPPWKRAFELAWASFGEGNFGIGAVLTDPRDSTEPIVAEGRNAVLAGPADQPIVGNYMAHAEMNAFATMSSFSARGLHLYTTLEPCLMCGATAIFLNLAEVRYAARDEYYEPFERELWPHHPYTATRQPTMSQPISGRLSAFARLLPLSHTIETNAKSAPAEHARTHRPQLSALAGSSAMNDLRQLARSGSSVSEGLNAVWSDLPIDEFVGI